MTDVDQGKPLVSVIMPCYQGARFISQALASVAAQTYRPIEAVVVDDGSSDESAEIVSDFNCPDTSVRLIRSETNQGIPITRNIAIDHAEGELIAFLDQDDLWLPHKIETQVRALQQQTPDARGIVCADILLQDLARRPEGPMRLIERASERFNDMNEDAVLAQLLKRNFISSVTVLASKEAVDSVGKFDPDLTGGADDWDLWLRIAERYPLVYVPEALAIYRVHGDNYTALPRMHGDEKRILDFWEQRRPDLADSIRLSRAKMTYHEGLHAFADRDWRQAAARASAAVRSAPLTMEFWPLLLKSTFKALAHGVWSPKASHS